MRRPNAYLTFTLDETWATPDYNGLLIRAYSYVCPTAVKKGTENEVLLTIKMGAHSYMDPADTEQQTSWDEEVSEWLRTKIRKVKETMEECDNPKRRGYMGVIPFTWLTLDIQGKQLRFYLADNNVPDVFEMIKSLRAELASQNISFNDIEYASFPCQDEIAAYQEKLVEAENKEVAAEAETAEEGEESTETPADHTEAAGVEQTAPELTYRQGQVILNTDVSLSVPLP